MMTPDPRDFLSHLAKIHLDLKRHKERIQKMQKELQVHRYLFICYAEDNSIEDLVFVDDPYTAERFERSKLYDHVDVADTLR